MTVRIITADVMDGLAQLPDASAHTVVTSPPYFGLRDYGTATWDGGDLECDHVEMTTGMSEKNTLGPDGYLPPTNAANVGRKLQYRHQCGKCGARRIDQQIGLEPTPDEYVAKLVAVFREVRRVLRDDGTLWLNLGDSYAAQRGGTPQPAETLAGGKGGKTADGARVNRGRHDGYNPTRNAHAIGLKHKDLIGIPWRVAFALQADGWYLRQDIIWSKPNPMPESVRDRCTKAHEYIFLMSKSARYYFDHEAIKEPAAGGNSKGDGKKLAEAAIARTGGRITGGTERSTLGTSADGTRNRRSVWTVTTQPFPEAHFATFPPALVEPCILAGCPEGGMVLDPFAGSGTTGLVAQRLRRDATLIELNPEYAAMARKRINADQPPMLAMLDGAS